MSPLKLTITSTNLPVTHNGNFPPNLHTQALIQNNKVLLPLNLLKLPPLVDQVDVNTPRHRCHRFTVLQQVTKLKLKLLHPNKALLEHTINLNKLELSLHLVWRIHNLYQMVNHNRIRVNLNLLILNSQHLLIKCRLNSIK